MLVNTVVGLDSAPIISKLPAPLIEIAKYISIIAWICDDMIKYVIVNNAGA